jgi:hypothetical protein
LRTFAIWRSAESRAFFLSAALAPSPLETGKLVLKVTGDRGDVGVAVVDQLLLLDVMLNLQVGQFRVAVLFVDAGDHVGSEVDDLFEVLRSQVKEVAQGTEHP